mmetsp:Transcript_29902/g.48704  ORF Transcript_29902/g.48704 Transcript_29902/m.48704 type:complete len:520 (+) Transcript_29902:46-1605(+)
MNNLFGFGSALGDIAKDLNGFVREVVEEFNTLPNAQKDNDDNEDEHQLDDEERAIEEELKHQLLQLSSDDDEDEDDGQRNDIANAESAVSSVIPQSNNDNVDQELQRELQAVDDDNDGNENNDDASENKQPNDVSNDSNNNNSAKPPIDDDNECKQETPETVSSAQFHALQQKYLQLKLNYRKSMLLVEKYQIHNKSLKESLNEQLILSEQQQSQMQEQQLVNDELDRKLAELQNKVEVDDGEMVTQSVTLDQSEATTNSQTENDDDDDDNDTNNNDTDNEPGMSKMDILKLKQTLQKASTNMKELKKRYKKVKDDLCQKIEEYDQLKSQYVTQKISASKEIRNLSNNLQTLSRQVQHNNSGLSKELQLILNAKFCLNEAVCESALINPLHLEMIGVVNGCMETVSWLIATSGVSERTTRRTSRDSAAEDNKSDSAVIVHDDDQEQNVDKTAIVSTANELSVEEMEAIKKNVICLRGVICEYIAIMQQWLKSLSDAIERKHEMNNVSPESNTEEFTNID